MKLVDARVKLEKELLYSDYIRIVYDYEDYDKITRKEMLKQIVDMYHEEHFMYLICTKRELDFIVKYHNKEIAFSDAEKYSWEIDELDSKYIFNRETFTFYDDYNDIIPNLIKYYQKHSKPDFTVSMFIVALVRLNGEMLTKALSAFVSQIYDIKDNDFDKVLGNPLIHFYCDYDYAEMGLGEEETIYYREYEDDIYELREQRKILGVAGPVSIDQQLYKDFFYYGLNYSNPKVKKMYDEIIKEPIGFLKLHMIDRSRLLGIPYMLSQDDDKSAELINEALLEIPCAAMNGITPKQRDEIMIDSKELKKQFSCIPQNNAHVHKQIANKFYYYYFALLEYINNKYKINTKIEKIFKQERLNPYDLYDIDEYLWHHLEVVDDFIKANPYKFGEEDFYYVRQFKTGLPNDEYVIVGMDKEYTKFLSTDGKIYMVKGLRADLDQVIDIKNIPMMVSTHLLMFENYIIYNGMISNYEIEFGNDFMIAVANEMKNAIKYYHF